VQRDGQAAVPAAGEVDGAREQGATGELVGAPADEELAFLLRGADAELNGGGCAYRFFLCFTSPPGPEDGVSVIVRRDAQFLGWDSAVR
jgi:hypothetical protein